MNGTKNADRPKEFGQVCVWPGTVVKTARAEGDSVKDFEEHVRKEFGVRVMYLEEITTAPDIENGKPVEGTGGRNDLFFAVHNEDVEKFAVPRLSVGIRWIGDVLSKENYLSPIYPERVFEYVLRKDVLTKYADDDGEDDDCDSYFEDIERLEEIRERMHELLEEAEEIVRNFEGGDMAYQRAKSYWLAHIKTALDDEHDYLGGSMVTMEDTINEMEKVNQ